MRGSRGGGPGVWTPLRFVRGGVLCGGLVVEEGGPMPVFISVLSNFSGSPRSPELETLKKVSIITSKFKGMRHNFLRFPFSSHHTNSTFHPWLLKEPFSGLLCQELHNFTPFKPKIFWRRTPRPPQYILHCQNNVNCVFVWGESSFCTT